MHPCPICFLHSKRGRHWEVHCLLGIWKPDFNCGTCVRHLLGVACMRCFSAEPSVNTPDGSRPLFERWAAYETPWAKNSDKKMFHVISPVAIALLTLTSKLSVETENTRYLIIWLSVPSRCTAEHMGAGSLPSQVLESDSYSSTAACLIIICKFQHLKPQNLLFCFAYKRSW